MDISSSSNTITIVGNIKTVGDFQSIKTAVDSIKNSYKTIILEIQDSISITSSIIGYLNKLVLKDGIDLNMKVGDKQLIALLEELNLAATFKVTAN